MPSEKKPTLLEDRHFMPDVGRERKNYKLSCPRNCQESSDLMFERFVSKSFTVQN